jgi:hypothetical protein
MIRSGGMTNDEGDLALLPQLLDRSFGAGPDGLPTPADRLAVARRALRRRRRLALAATSVGVLAAVGAGAGLAGVGGERGADPSPPLATSSTTASTNPSADPSEEVSAEQQEALDRLARKAREQAHRLEQRQVSSQFPASLDSLGGPVIVKDGWRITQRVEEPMGYVAPEASLGVVVTDGEDTRWMLLTLQYMQDGAGNPIDALSPSASADDPGKGYSRFEDWLASMVSLNGGAQTPPLVTVDGGDHLRPGPGAVLVETRAAPVIDGYTSAGDRMAQLTREDRTWFVVVRGHGPQAEVLPVDADVLSAPTFAAFVDHLTTQIESGEGVR